MIKHIIIWDLKDGLSEGEKAECSAKIKNDLEDNNLLIKNKIG